MPGVIRQLPFLRAVRIAALALLPALSWPAAPPAPETFFGHRMGADRKLLDWARVVEYFQRLEQASDRIQVRELGRSTEGRPFIAATIAAPETLERLDFYRDIQARLADPRRTPLEDARRLIPQGKTVVLITCSIHATEVASTHTAVEFAYRLLTEDTPRFRAILANTIFLLVPSLNPDGVDIVTEWYRRTLGTRFEGSRPPRLYHKYTGHDNNRDWYLFSQVETRLAVEHLHNVWHPQIVYDVHQMGETAARIFVPPWVDPVDPNVDPLLVHGMNAIGAGMALDLTAAGLSGVVINGMYDFWTPSRHYQAYRGGMRILSESASARIATPVEIRPEQLDRPALGYNPARRSWNHPDPWPGGVWRLRDIVDYQSVAFESCLYQAALRREDLLWNFYRMGQRAVERTAPYAFVLPAAQRDPGAARKLLEILDFGQIEIGRAKEAFRAGGRRYPAGSYVIALQQPYGGWAKTLLEPQRYPDLREYEDGPPRRPYDVTAHTLPLLFGVQADQVDEPFRAPLEPVRQFYPAPPDPSPPLAAADSASWRIVNRAWQENRPVWRDQRTGDFHFEAGSGRSALPAPRIGLYQSYIPIMDEGWTRWILEEFGFASTTVRNQDIRAGGLTRRFDVLVFPDQPAASIEHGFSQESMPREFTRGIGAEGLAALVEFARAGGTVILLNRSTELAEEGKLANASNLLAAAPETQFYCPGSLLWARLEPGDPLTLGLPAEVPLWVEGGAAWEPADLPGAKVLARYPTEKVLASGWLLGEHRLAGKAALLEIPAGQGRLLLFGFRPQYRAQSYQTLKLFFNALLPR